MPVQKKTARAIAARLLDNTTLEERAEALQRRLPDEDPLPPRIPSGNDHTTGGMEKRRSILTKLGRSVTAIGPDAPPPDPTTLSANIENLVGYARLPIGIAGPLRINGTYAHGDFYVPMATTEGALVASCNRGAYVISNSGGASVMCLTESVSRAPCFMFESMAQAAQFIAWVLDSFDSLKEIAGQTTRHGVLTDLRTSIVAKEVYVNFEYQTGDASGQNMVTIATEAVCNHIVEHAPIKPLHWYLEGNLSGDKKATMLSYMFVRGKKVIAEAVITRKLTSKILRCQPEDMVRYWQISVLGGIQSGSIGTQGHFANSLAAIFIACGQDAACVSEASVGLTRMDLTAENDLYVSVTLPNMIVGTVGGGTHLPTARECLEMLDCYGDGGARRLAEICAATALAGEISIIAALAAGDFGSAHERYGRSKE